MKTPHFIHQHQHTLTFVLLLAIFAAVLHFFWGGFTNLFFRWSFQPEYSHGFLIPFVSLYILWESKHRWVPHLGDGSLWGVPLCALAFLIALMGEVSALYLLIHYAFILFLFGVSLCVIGRATKNIWVPIALLGFAVPLPYVIEVLLTAKLQLLSSSMGVALIRLFNIPVHLSGNIIDMGALQLHVVEACSGLRYLFPLASMGVVTAYFYHASMFKKILVVVSTVPITIVLNSVRIGITGVVVDRYGVEHAQGFLHDFEGWIIFVVCLAILVFEIIILERCTTKRSLIKAFAPNQTASDAESISSYHLKKMPLLSVLLVSVLSIALLNHLDMRKEVVPQGVSFASFPMQLGEWQGVRQVIQDDVSEALSYTDAIMADYIHESDLDNGINFYMAYYESQRKGVSPHSPKVCIPGGGWEITEFSRTTLHGMPVNRSVIQKGQQAQLVYYWFVERGEIVANEYKKKWWLFLDAIKDGRSDGALVRVVAPIPQQAKIQEVDERVKEFVAHVHPRVMAYLPQKNRGDAW